MKNPRNIDTFTRKRKLQSGCPRSVCGNDARTSGPHGNPGAADTGPPQTRGQTLRWSVWSVWPDGVFGVFGLACDTDVPLPTLPLPRLSRKIFHMQGMQGGGDFNRQSMIFEFIDCIN